jgi:hypothetical protein
MSKKKTNDLPESLPPIEPVEGAEVDLAAVGLDEALGDRDEQIADMHAAGASLREIGVAVNRSPTRIRQILEKVRSGDGRQRSVDPVVAAARREAQVTELQLKQLKAAQAIDLLQANAGGGGLGGGGSAYVLLQMQQLQNQLNQQGQFLQQLVGELRDIREKPAVAGTTSPAAEFAKGFREYMTVMKELQPMPAPEAKSPEQYELMARLSEESSLRRDQLALDRARWEETSAQARAEWESKRENREYYAKMAQQHLPTAMAFIQQMVQAQVGKNGHGEAGVAGPPVQCPSCHGAIEITPGAGPTRWRCPNCKAIMVHNPGAMILVLEQAGQNGAPPDVLPDLLNDPSIPRLSDGSVSATGLASAIYAKSIQASKKAGLAGLQPSGPPKGGYTIAGQDTSPIGDQDGGLISPPGPPSGGYRIAPLPEE